VSDSYTWSEAERVVGGRERRRVCNTRHQCTTGLSLSPLSGPQQGLIKTKEI